MLTFAQVAQQRAICSVPWTVRAGECVRLQKRFKVVENEQVASFAEQLNQQRDLFIFLMRNSDMWFGDRRDNLVEGLVEARRVLQRTVQDSLKLAHNAPPKRER